MSKREGEILALIKGLAAERNLPYKQDAAGNLLLKAPGRGAGVGAPPVCIQGHVDMVTEKNSATVHDFATDPITLRRSADGKWISADETTLGADNGIGVAAGLALLDEPDPIDLPPLELLFTVDEETGLNGAKALDAAALGITAKTLLNLDTEASARSSAPALSEPACRAVLSPCACRALCVQRAHLGVAGPAFPPRSLSP